MIKKWIKQVPEVKGLWVSVVIFVVFVVKFEVVAEFVLVEDKVAVVDIVLLVLIKYLNKIFD